MPEFSRIFARKYEILPPPTSIAEEMRLTGKPTFSKNSLCSCGGMITVMLSFSRRMKSPLGI